MLISFVVTTNHLCKHNSHKSICMLQQYAIEKSHTAIANFSVHLHFCFLHVDTSRFLMLFYLDGFFFFNFKLKFCLPLTMHPTFDALLFWFYNLSFSSSFLLVFFLKKEDPFSSVRFFRIKFKPHTHSLTLTSHQILTLHFVKRSFLYFQRKGENPVFLNLSTYTRFGFCCSRTFHFADLCRWSVFLDVLERFFETNHSDKAEEETKNNNNM